MNYDSPICPALAGKGLLLHVPEVFLYSELLYQNGQDFLDIQYLRLYVLEPLLSLLILKIILGPYQLLRYP